MTEGHRSRRDFLGLGVAAGLSLPLACSRESSTPPETRCPAPASSALQPEASTETPREDPFASLRGFCDGIEGPDAAEFSRRRERLRESMGREGLDLVLFEAGLNTKFFSGVRWGQSERPLIYALFADGREAWTGPAFEARRLRESIGEQAELSVWEEQASPYDNCAALLKKLDPKAERVGLDPNMRFFVADGLRRSLGRAKVGSGAEAIAGVRMVKEDAELARLRRANEATKAALKVASKLIVPGMREGEARSLIREAQEAAGLSNIWVLALFGPSAAFPHGTREERTLGEGELVLVDTGGNLHGYQSDITRTWAPSGASDGLRKAWDTVLAAQSAALAQVKAGATCGLADAAARKVIEQAGYGTGYAKFTHRLGHGIGIQGHEEPYLRMGNARVLKPGMTMSDEPGIYVPGEFGVRIEDIVAVTEGEAEVFGPRGISLDDPFGA